MANPNDVYTRIFTNRPIRNGASCVLGNGAGPSALADGLQFLSQPFPSALASGTFDREYNLSNIDGYAFAGENLSNLYRHSYLTASGTTL